MTVKDAFADLESVLKLLSVNPKHAVYKNPSVTDILSLTEEDVGNVWEKFQFGISKREMYNIKSATVQPVLDKMRNLPIVGKKKQIMCIAVSNIKLQELSKRKVELN